MGERFLLSQKDVGKIGTLKLKPIYMILFFAKRLAITEGESTFHMNKKYLKYTIKNYYKKPIYRVRETRSF